MKNREKNYTLEFLRVVFTLYIVLRHVLATIGVKNNLWLGVEFFFVLSGFLLVVTYRPTTSVFQFWVLRYLRFAPLVAFGCLLCLFFRPFKMMALVSNLLFLSETLFHYRLGAFNPPSWYLCVLLCGGAGIFMIIKYCPARWAIISIGTFLGLSYLRFYGYEPLISGAVPAFFVPHVLIRGCAEMGVGCIAGKFFLSETSAFLKRPTPLRTVLFWCALCLSLVGPWLPSCSKSDYITMLVLVNAALVFFSAMGDNVLNRPVWGKFSRYALSVFTTHYFLIFLLDRRYVQNVSRTGGLDVVVAIATVALALLTGILAHHLVEIPCAKAIERIQLKNRRVR